MWGLGWKLGLPGRVQASSEHPPSILANLRICLLGKRRSTDLAALRYGAFIMLHNVTVRRHDVIVSQLDSTVLSRALCLAYRHNSLRPTQRIGAGGETGCWVAGDGHEARGYLQATSGVDARHPTFYPSHFLSKNAVKRYYDISVTI